MLLSSKQVYYQDQSLTSNNTEVSKNNLESPHLGKINPLTTDDAFWCCQILAACHQLPQSIGSALAERVGQRDVGGCTALGDRAFWQLRLPVEKPWSMPGAGGPFVYFLAQTGVENAPFTL